MIACEDDHILRFIATDNVEVLGHCVSGAAVPGFAVYALLRGQKIDKLVHLFTEERPTALDMLHQRMRLILRDNPDTTNARVDAVREREVDNAKLTAEMNGRLGAGRGQIFQPCTATTSQDQRHGFQWQLSCQH